MARDEGRAEARDEARAQDGAWGMRGARTRAGAAGQAADGSGVPAKARG